MTLQEGFTKAVEGGYPERKLPWCQECAEDVYRVLSDPLFWQALGKSMGWEGYCDIYGTDVEAENTTGKGMYAREVWYWHRFIDHLAVRGSIEQYFETL